MIFGVIAVVIVLYVFLYRENKKKNNDIKISAFDFSSTKEQIEKFGEKLRSDLFMQEENGKVHLTFGDEK